MSMIAAHDGKMVCSNDGAVYDDKMVYGNDEYGA